MAYAEFPERHTIELTVRGFLCRADYDAVMAPMARFIQRYGDTQVIEVVDSFAGFQDPIINDPTPDSTSLLSHIKRVALVSDIGWFCPILSSAPVTLGIRIKSFKRAELEDARRWVVFPEG